MGRSCRQTSHQSCRRESVPCSRRASARRCACGRPSASGSSSSVECNLTKHMVRTCRQRSSACVPVTASSSSSCEHARSIHPLGNLALDNRFEASLLRLRQPGQEFGHAKVLRLAQPLQFLRCGLEHHTGALHRQVKRLKAVDAEDISGPPVDRVQARNLQRTAPVRTGNRLRYTKGHDYTFATG